ncbi:MAG: M48 family metallopeptidase, partial [Bacteroidia bacterium]|nr:M48 family metallopeptidase [Bacteroidia bacterium]
HELAHLREMNHSPEFWSIVKKIMPGYRQKELWLKENGVKLKF